MSNTQTIINKKALSKWLIINVLLLLLMSCDHQPNNNNSQLIEGDSVYTQSDTNNTVDNITINGEDTLTKVQSSTTTTTIGIEHTADYICPMHCAGSGDSILRTCNVCGMDFIENPNK